MELAIDKCTDSKRLDDDWGLILNISDTYAVGSPKQCVKYITKKIFQQNPHTSLRALTLLDGCILNAGNSFARELSSRDFTHTVKSKYSKLGIKPRLKLIELAKKWANEYKSNSEMSMLVDIFTWLKSEHQDNVLEFEESCAMANSVKNKSVSKDLLQKEEDNLAKAIALSLKDTGGNPQSSSMPVINPASGTAKSIINPKPLKDLVPVQVRSLFDFEAVEDNELTLKEGEIITVLDSSDENWWLGRGESGEGYFPAQFVTRDLNVKEKKESTVSQASKLNDEREENQLPVQIDQQLLENCLQMLNDADSTGTMRPDPPDLEQTEARCRAMESLINNEMTVVDSRIYEVDELNQKLVDALQQYHDLMSRTPAPQQNFTSGMYGQRPLTPISNQPHQNMVSGQILPAGSGPVMYGMPSVVPNPVSIPPQMVYQQPPGSFGYMAPIQYAPPVAPVAYPGEPVPHVYATQGGYFPQMQPLQGAQPMYPAFGSNQSNMVSDNGTGAA